MEIALEGTTDGLWDINLKTNKVFYSKEWKAMLGYKDHEIENKVEAWKNLVHPDDLKRVETHSQKHIENKIPSFYNEYRMRCKDGSYKWILDRGKIVERTSDGEPLRMMGIHSDISERKDLENTLKQIEKVLTRKSGKNYYEILAKELNKILKGDIIIIAEYNAQKTVAKSLAYLNNNKILPSISYNLENTPCELVSKNGYCVYNKNVAQIFKNDVFLSDFKIESYIGKAIYNSDNESIGQLVVMYCDSLKSSDSLQSIIQLFANKFGSEIERNILLKELYQKQEELLESQRIAKLGSYNLNLVNLKPTTSPTFDSITGFGSLTAKTFKEWSSIVHPDDVLTNQKMLEHCIKTGAEWEREYRIITADTNKTKWIYGKGEVVYDKKGVPINFVGIIQDISKRKRDELTKQIIYNITKKASATHNLTVISNYIKTELAQLIDTTNFFIALYNEETDMISTPFMVDEQDDGSDFPKGKTLTGYLIDTKKPILANHNDLLKLKKEKKIAVLGPLSKCWLGVPLIIQNKAIGAIVVQSYKDKNAFSKEDVGLLELMAANIGQVIKQSQDYEQIRLLSHALTQSPEAVVVTNINGCIEYVNPAFTALSGYSRKEVIGLNPRFLKTEHQKKDFYKNLWHTILNGKVWNGEFINKRKDGLLYIVNANISGVKNKEGNITHFVAVEEDITEKRKLEHDFLSAFINAQEIEKQSFGEDLHDGVSQILSAQTMFIDVLKKLTKDYTGKIPEYLDNVKELNTKAINETRSIAHGLMSKQLKENGLINAIAQICKDYNTSKDIKFSFTCNGILEEEIKKEIKSNIFRIVQEVTTNTVRHSLATKAQINMNKTAKNELKVVLKDNGVGIDFERNKANHKGTGLENIKRRIALLSGSVILKSEIGKGTQYVLLVPLENPI